MVLIRSKLTANGQTTIPQPVRTALGLQPGDELLYEVEGSRVILAKVRKEADADDLFTTFGEWHSQADARAYARL